MQLQLSDGGPAMQLQLSDATHLSTHDTFNFLDNIPDEALTELIDYYEDIATTLAGNKDKGDTERKLLYEAVDHNPTTHSIEMLDDDVPADHKSSHDPLLHFTTPKSTVYPTIIAPPDDAIDYTPSIALTRTPCIHTHLSPFCQPKKKGKIYEFS